MAKTKITPALQELHTKYFRLVSYARKGPEDYAVAERGMKETEFLHGEDVEQLKGEHGDWHHGFNSGMLAALRLVLDAQEYGWDEAMEEFPSLDT
jgi:hypothetical protein